MGTKNGQVIIYAADSLESSTINAPLMKSTNRGETWEHFAVPFGGKVLGIATLPNNADVVFIGVLGAGVFKSTDGGNTWIYPAQQPSNRLISRITLDPLNPDIVWAGCLIQSLLPVVHRSSDGGQHWEQFNLGQMPQNELSVSDIAVSGSYVWVSTYYDGGTTAINNLGIYRTTNGGQEWTREITGMIGTDPQCASLAIDPSNPNILYAGTFNIARIYKTVNGTTNCNWVEYYSTSTGDYSITDLRISHQNSGVIYGTNGNYSYNGGVLKSTNAGQSWQVLTNGIQANKLASICVDPLDAQIVYAGGLGACYRSNNGGSNWVEKNMNLLVSPVATLQKAGDFVLGTWPANSIPIYPERSFRSLDDGSSWEIQVIDGNASRFLDAAVSISSVGLLIGGRAPILYPYPNVARTTNKGNTWNQISLPYSGFGLLQGTCGTFASSSVVYVAGYGLTTSEFIAGCVWKSVDGGITWSTPAQIANAVINTLGLSGSTIYVGGNRGEASVWKSTNGGVTWTETRNGLPGINENVKSLSVEPSDSEVVYAGTNVGVYKTTNGGSAWVPMNNGIALLDIQSVLIHPQNSSVVYAGANGGLVYRSTNGGQNWSGINGLAVSSVNDLTFDFNNPNRLYVATDAGVYHIAHRWAGELSASATWKTGSEYLVEGTLTVPLGVTLNIQSGAIVKFMQNAELKVDGVLNADAAGGAPISFAPNTSGQLWNGISFGTSSGSIVRNANITGAQTGISARHNIGLIVDDCMITDGGTGVYLYSASGGGSVGTAILNNTISNMPILAGVYVDAGASLAIIQDNTITGPGSYGMYFVQASPVDVVRNKTSGFDKAGIYCYSASPSFVNALLGGHNCSFSNDIGVWAKYKAYPNLGSTVMSASGVNTISLNASFAIMLQDNCDVNAEDDWFDEDGPDAHDFSVDASSTLSYEPFLTGQDPNGCIGGSAPLAGGGTEGKNEEGMATGMLDDPLARQAMTFRLQRRHHEAMNLLKAIIASRQSGERLIEWAMSELLANYQMISAPGGNDRLSRYLRTTLQNTSNNRIARTIRDVVAGASLHEGDRSGMNAALDDAIRLHPNTESEVLALYQKISAAMNAGEVSSARAALQTLSARYPRHELTHAASALVGAQGGGTAPMTSVKKNGGSLASGSPLTFGLEQNFPNPFNPTTTIRFAIPQNEHVTLKVYDLLGREVATLVNEARSAGNHEAFFDASNLASGVYIYRLTAGNFIATKKFTLIK